MNANSPQNLSPLFTGQTAQILADAASKSGEIKAKQTESQTLLESRILQAKSSIDQVINALSTMIASGGKFETTEQAIKSALTQHVTTQSNAVLSALASKADGTLFKHIEAMVSEVDKRAFYPNSTFTGSISRSSAQIHDSAQLVDVSGPGVLTRLYKGEGGSQFNISIDGKHSFTTRNTTAEKNVLGGIGELSPIYFSSRLIVIAEKGHGHTGSHCEASGMLGVYE